MDQAVRFLASLIALDPQAGVSLEPENNEFAALEETLETKVDALPVPEPTASKVSPSASPRLPTFSVIFPMNTPPKVDVVAPVMMRMECPFKPAAKMICPAQAGPWPTDLPVTGPAFPTLFNLEVDECPFKPAAKMIIPAQAGPWPTDLPVTGPAFPTLFNLEVDEDPFSTLNEAF